MITETQTVPSPSGHTDVMAALKAASHRTGSDFAYLLSTAMRESGLDSHAKSATSSASGLFQFVDRTWLGLIKRFGERYGLGAYAGAIEDKGGGHYTVASHEAKAAILALRQDANISALMAGEAAKATKRSLECALGRPVCDGELYAAHFLGEGGARQLLETRACAPDSRADALFPQAAKANRTVFYHADGAPKTVSELYAWLVKDSRAAAPAAVPATPAPTHAMPAVHVAAAIAGTEPAHDSAILRSSVVATDVAPDAPAAPRTALAESSFAPTQMPSWGLPQPPLLLNPGLMEILSALAPPLDSRRTS